MQKGLRKSTYGATLKPIKFELDEATVPRSKLGSGNSPSPIRIPGLGPTPCSQRHVLGSSKKKRISPIKVTNETFHGLLAQTRPKSRRCLNLQNLPSAQLTGKSPSLRRTMSASLASVKEVPSGKKKVTVPFKTGRVSSVNFLEESKIPSISKKPSNRENNIILQRGRKSYSSREERKPINIPERSRKSCFVRGESTSNQVSFRKQNPPRSKLPQTTTSAKSSAEGDDAYCQVEQTMESQHLFDAINSLIKEQKELVQQFTLTKETFTQLLCDQKKELVEVKSLLCGQKKELEEVKGLLCDLMQNGNHRHQLPITFPSEVGEQTDVCIAGNKENSVNRPKRKKSLVHYQQLRADVGCLKTPILSSKKTNSSKKTPKSSLSRKVQAQLESLLDDSN